MLAAGRIATSQRLRACWLPPCTYPLRAPNTHFYARTEEGRRQSFLQRKKLLLRKSPGYRYIKTGGRSGHLAIPLKLKYSAGSRGNPAFVALRLLIFKFIPIFLSLENMACV